MLRILGHKCRLTGSQRSAGAENYHVILLSLPGGVPESSQVQRDMMGSDAQRPGHSRSSTWRSCLWFTQSSYHLCVALLEVVSVRDNDQGCPDERVPDHPTSCVPCSVLCFTKGPIHACFGSTVSFLSTSNPTFSILVRPCLNNFVVLFAKKL